jgi:O-glycosyl hydrolase
LWYTLQSWAKFQPRHANPRSVPGDLYYPAQYTHIFQKYWDHLNDPLSHPDSGCESDHTKAAMNECAIALYSTDLSSFEPMVDAEASDKSCRIARDAALSRRCPIQDAIDYWVSQEEAVTGSGGLAPGQDVHNVDT